MSILEVYKAVWDIIAQDMLEVSCRGTVVPLLLKKRQRAGHVSCVCPGFGLQDFVQGFG